MLSLRHFINLLTQTENKRKSLFLPKTGFLQKNKK